MLTVTVRMWSRMREDVRIVRGKRRLGLDSRKGYMFR